jgi:hypothetical protein
MSATSSRIAVSGESSHPAGLAAPAWRAVWASSAMIAANSGVTGEVAVSAATRQGDPAQRGEHAPVRAEHGGRSHVRLGRVHLAQHRADARHGRGCSRNRSSQSAAVPRVPGLASAGGAAGTAKGGVHCR